MGLFISGLVMFTVMCSTGYIMGLIVKGIVPNENIIMAWFGFFVIFISLKVSIL